MKLLVIEYICSGGCYGQPLPGTLAAEGRLMLQAMLDELNYEQELELLVPLDTRFLDMALPANATAIVVNTANWLELFEQWLNHCDTVLLLAPESNDLLAALAERIYAHAKPLLLSDPASIRLCANKWLSYQVLQQHGIAAVPTAMTTNNDLAHADAYVIKPIDGLGCEGSRIIPNRTDSSAIENPNYIIQPLIEGESLSLSAVFQDGQSWLLSCNQQCIKVTDASFQLQGCRVNLPQSSSQRAHYQQLLHRIAQAMPGLWGYIGIDIMESARYGTQVLEINPRLTTSYAGLYQATGIRLIRELLRLADGQITDFRPAWHKTIAIAITGATTPCSIL